MFLLSFFSKLPGDAVHGDGSGEADEAAAAVGGEDPVFGLSDAQRAEGAEPCVHHVYSLSPRLICSVD